MRKFKVFFEGKEINVIAERVTELSGQLHFFNIDRSEDTINTVAKFFFQIGTSIGYLEIPGTVGEMASPQVS